MDPASELIKQLWIFMNNEDHKNDNRTIAQYKQQTLDVRVTQQYATFQNNDLPLKTLQQSHFDITQEELLILSFDINHAWLRSAVRANKTCLTPVLNKLLTLQLLIHKRTEGIVFDNDAKGCYDRIISGIALACLKNELDTRKNAKLP
jgi:hypothetical protein